MYHAMKHTALKWLGHWQVALMHALLLIMLLLAPPTAEAQPVSSDSPTGYIDPAVVQNQVRLRFDAAYGNPFPDRSEFFYPTCGCFPGAPARLCPNRKSTTKSWKLTSNSRSIRIGRLLSKFQFVSLTQWPMPMRRASGTFARFEVR